MTYVPVKNEAGVHFEHHLDDEDGEDGRVNRGEKRAELTLLVVVGTNADQSRVRQNHHRHEHPEHPRFHRCSSGDI